MARGDRDTAPKIKRLFLLFARTLLALAVLLGLTYAGLVALGFRSMYLENRQFAQGVDIADQILLVVFRKTDIEEKYFQVEQSSLQEFKEKVVASVCYKTLYDEFTEKYPLLFERFRIQCYKDGELILSATIGFKGQFVDVINEVVNLSEEVPESDRVNFVLSDADFENRKGVTIQQIRICPKKLLGN
ncbi:MAG: hypothetical protein KF851_04295 [Pirellulaceae bacterium]|nr:hypothetical protein [Pirellulaceae bacterium]